MWILRLKGYSALESIIYKCQKKSQGKAPLGRGCQETSCIEANCLRVSTSDLSLAGQGCRYYIFLYFLAIDWITKTSAMGRKKRNSEDPLDTNRRQSQTCAGQDDQARVHERPISANPGLKFVPIFVFTFQCIA